MMARQYRPGDGVGRGNGAGSARTQFKAGMPSANPRGRPRKPKTVPSTSLKEAVLKGLTEQISTTENGVARKRPRSEAMIMLLLAHYPTVNAREKLAILRYLGNLAPEAELMPSRELPENAIQDLVAMLAQEAKDRELD